MKLIDMFIILLMAVLLGASVYCNFVLPKKMDKWRLERLEKEKLEKSKNKIA